MSEDLKSAIRTIAEYDGWVKYEDGDYRHKDRDWWDDFLTEEKLGYHTSADALLPVWRKVRDRLKETDDWSYEYGKMYDILKMVGFNDLPEACLKLAEIISQLKEQK